MEVGVGVLGHVVVDHHIDTLDIDTSSKQVGGNHDTGLELLELLVFLDSVIIVNNCCNKVRKCEDNTFPLV